MKSTANPLIFVCIIIIIITIVIPRVYCPFSSTATCLLFSTTAVRIASSLVCSTCAHFAESKSKNKEIKAPASPRQPFSNSNRSLQSKKIKNKRKVKKKIMASLLLIGF